MANETPKTTAAKTGVHIHVANGPYHDEHTCPYRTCALCGQPIRYLAGVWVAIEL